MGVFDDAHDIIRGLEIPEALNDFARGGYAWDGMYSGNVEEVDTDTLLATFSYQIRLDTSDVKDESAVPIGTSKHRGLPHLPAGMPWPEHMFFDTQINLAELAAVDVSGRLPTSGMLYFFQSNRHGTVVESWNGDPAELQIREYPDPKTLDDSEYYLEDFLKESSTLALQPFWLFYMNQGDAHDYRGLRPALPEEFIQRMDAVLRAELGGWDFGFRLYGRPQYWQGEDEGEMPVDFDEDGMPIWGEPVDKLLLLQTDLGDAAIHFWCDPGAAARGDFSEVWSTFSGT